MRKAKQLETAALARLRERLEKADSLRERNREKPFEFLAERGFRFPGPMGELFMDVYQGRVDRAIGLAGRGGGKSCEAGALAFALWAFDDWNVGIVSGSREQALRVIEYVQDITGDEVVAEIVAEETKTLVKGKRGNWIKAASASTKAIRGLHAKGRKMLLILDEEAEMDPAIVRSALSVVSDAKRAVVLRLSTMHKIDGTFADLVDRHEKMGYRLYRWDSFDVATRCKTKDCADCLDAFSQGNTPGELGQLARDFHDRYCRERAKDTKRPEGWIRVETIRQNYMEMPTSWFETEVMALKPSGEGKVLDYDKVKAAFEASPAKFVPGAPIWGWVDWGFKGQMTAGVYQAVGNDVLLVDATAWTGVDVEVLIAWFRGKEEELAVINPDSSHPFENNKLREAGWEVDEVVFGAFKETGAGFLKWLFDRERLKPCAKFPDVLAQLLAWSRDAQGKIIKGFDHYCDGMLAGTKRLSAGMGEGTARFRKWDPGAGKGFFRMRRTGRRAEMMSDER
ncbi:MAG: hypothetical protein WC713_08670 [Candidatus Methylomirabilota bacterium]